MFVPDSFAKSDLKLLHDFMEQHSFATLVSSHQNEPVATHLPLLLDRDAGSRGRLIGHVARANSQWQSAAGQRVLIMFHGPYAYISPSWYGARNVVPTWNYATVHAYGELRLIEDHERLHAMVARTVAVHEGTRREPWRLESVEPGFVEGLLAGIVGFEVELDRLEGKWKLNQHHPPARQQQVIRGLRETGRHDEALIADLMTTEISGQSSV